VTGVLLRLNRKAAEIQRWAGSMHPFKDWPAGVWCRPELLHGLWVRLNPSAPAQFVIYEDVFITQVYDLERVRCGVGPNQYRRFHGC
jgi:hypothetical protein